MRVNQVGLTGLTNLLRECGQCVCVMLACVCMSDSIREGDICVGVRKGIGRQG